MNIYAYCICIIFYRYVDNTYVASNEKGHFFYYTHMHVHILPQVLFLPNFIFVWTTYLSGNIYYNDKFSGLLIREEERPICAGNRRPALQLYSAHDFNRLRISKDFGTRCERQSKKIFQPIQFITASKLSYFQGSLLCGCSAYSYNTTRSLCECPTPIPNLLTSPKASHYSGAQEISTQTNLIYYCPIHGHNFVLTYLHFTFCAPENDDFNPKAQISVQHPSFK